MKSYRERAEDIIVGLLLGDTPMDIGDGITEPVVIGCKDGEFRMTDRSGEKGLSREEAVNIIVAFFQQGPS